MTSATSSTDSDASSAAAPCKELPGQSWTEMLRGRDRVLIRPIHKSDGEMERQFIEALSPQSRRLRFLEALDSPSDELLGKFTAINPLTEAYVAVVGEGPQKREVGVARFSAQADGRDCEFAVVVRDEWQEKGLGTLLMQHLMVAARRLGIEEMHSSDLQDNNLMRKFAQHLHLVHKRDPDDISQVLYTVDLRSHPIQRPANAV